MSRRFIFILTGILLLIIIIFFVWQRLFRVSETSVASEEPSVEISGSELLNTFQINEDSANSLFLGKVILVSGQVNSIDEDSATFSVYLKGQDDLTGVMCIFNKPVDLTSSVKVGSEARIKGLCSGYLLDVILNKCAMAD